MHDKEKIFETATGMFNKITKNNDFIKYFDRCSFVFTPICKIKHKLKNTR